MRKTARALGNALLEHLRHYRDLTESAHHARKPPVIAYKDLIAKAGISLAPIGIGPHLLEVAEWCRDKGLPPLNALAVNAHTDRPGASYDGAGDFEIAKWTPDLVAVTSCRTYPHAIV